MPAEVAAAALDVSCHRCRLLLRERPTHMIERAACCARSAGALCRSGANRLLCMLAGESPPRKGQHGNLLCQLTGALRTNTAISATPFAVWMLFCGWLSLAWLPAATADQAARIMPNAICEARRQCARAADAHARGMRTERTLVCGEEMAHSVAAREARACMRWNIAWGVVCKLRVRLAACTLFASGTPARSRLP